MKIPGFDIVEKLGEGSMGTVWKAEQLSLDRVVAIKILKPEFARDVEDIRDFVNEAKAAAKVNHPNIIQVYDVAEHQGVHYIVMEFVDGSTLRRLLDERGAVPQRKALAMARTVAEALGSAWERAGIIHRDVKPENIMIGPDGTVKVADLGLARTMDRGKVVAQIQSGLLEGTPNYMSPEQVRCEATQDCRTDIYSLGATLYNALTGRVPFGDLASGEALQQHIDGHLPNPRDVVPALSIGAAVLVTKMMMKDPKDRYGDWPEVIQDIKKVAAGRILVQKHETYLNSTIRPPSLRVPSDEPGLRRWRASRGQPVPAWVRWPAWAALAAWLLFAAGRQFSPVDLLFGTPRPAGTRLPEADAEQPTAPPTDARRPVRGTAERIAKNVESPGGDGSRVGASLAPLRDAVAERLIRGDLDGAVDRIVREQDQAQTPDAKKEIEALRDMVREVANTELLVRAGIREKVDREIVLRLNQKEVTLIPRAAAGDRFNAVIKAAGGNTGRTDSVTLDLSQIHPVDRANLVAPADTPGRCAVRFFLFAQGGDYKAAGSLAGRCGPLSEPLLRYANAKLKAAD